MSQAFVKTKPSFLEAGLPCASLSAECQRDNNALRPPQNRLHIWWARRPPTVSRAAILAGLLPYDFQMDMSILPSPVQEPSIEDLIDLPRRFQEYVDFYKNILDKTAHTSIPNAHQAFLQVMGILGDADAAYRRLKLRDELCLGGPQIPLPNRWAYPHERAFALNPSTTLLRAVLLEIRHGLGLGPDQPIRMADSMAGGGTIPLEAVRYGFEVYANDVNPVAALILKATIEYPATYGSQLRKVIESLARRIEINVNKRLAPFYPMEPSEEWWPDVRKEAEVRFRSRRVVAIEPAGLAVARDFLWLRILPCTRCNLNIPLSTNFLIAKSAGRPA